MLFGGKYIILYAGGRTEIPKPQFKIVRTTERHTVFTLGIKIFAVLTFEALEHLEETKGFC